MKTFPAHRFQNGLTLIELMIAMVLGVFLMAGILKIFSSSKQAYKLQENLSRLQENGRFAMDFITKDVRMAGYTGCASAITPNVIAKPRVPPILAIGTGIQGLDNVTTNWNATACGNECIANTDVISFQSASSCQAQLTGKMNVVNANIQINAACTQAQIDAHDPNCNTCGIVADQIVVISNCTSSDIFAATSASNGAGKQTVAHANNVNIDNNLSTTYGTDAEIFAPKLMSYFIRTGAGGLPALWRIDNTTVGATPVELIEGIQDMQVLYGVDSDPTQDYIPDYYVTATKVPASISIPDGTTVDGWTRVVSVRVSLLASSIDDGLTFATKADGSDAPQPYVFNGATVTPTDRRIRRVFSTTIAIRNRLP